MNGFIFSKYDPQQNNQKPFDRLFNLFMELLHYTSGDGAEAQLAYPARSETWPYRR